LFIGDDEVVGLESTLGAIEEPKLFAFASEADDDAPLDLVEVEGVRGMPHTHEDKVRGIDRVRDLLLAEEIEIFCDAAVGGHDGDVAEDLGGEASAEALRIGGNGDREGLVDESSYGEFGVQRREREVVDGGGFTGDAIVIHGVDAVGRNVHL